MTEISNTIILTFDTDWVPQCLLERTLAVLEDANAKATIFCTGAYDLGTSGLFEAGLHPNFLPGSTQGETPEETLRWLLSIYPDAVGSRSHKYCWYSEIRGLLTSHGLLYDCSLLLIQQRCLQVYDHLGLRRVATWWSDNVHLHRAAHSHRFAPEGVDSPGLKVLDFHPIHVALNTPNLEWYRNAVRKLPPVPELTESEIDAVRYKGEGVASLLASAVAYIKKRQGQGLTLKEVVERENQKQEA